MPTALLFVKSAPPVPSDTESQFTTWTRRLRDADRQAYGEVFQTLHEPLLRYAWRHTHDAEAARDVVQDAFMKLWQVRDTLDPGASLRGLLYTMVRNRALNYNRDHANRQTPLELTDVPQAPSTIGPGDTLDADRLQEKLRHWIDDLPARRREAFRLSRFEGLSHDEIANVMGLSPSTVNRHIVLALQTLRDRLRTFDPDWKRF